jgi:RNA polymerase sigma-70 factor (ECF subfamily)
VVIAAQSTRSGAGPSDAALVVAARAGEDWAIEALFRRHAGRVNALALRLIGRDADVDDLVQESFQEAFKCLGRLDRPEAFAGWLRAIVVNQAGKLVRRRRLLARFGLGRGSLAIDVDSLISPAAPPDVSAELRRIYAAVERLPASLRIPLVLRRVEGLPLAEVAEATGLSLATVKRRVAEAERRFSNLKGDGR